jgi:rhodanese-related sulfurtransferase
VAPHPVCRPDEALADISACDERRTENGELGQNRDYFVRVRYEDSYKKEHVPGAKQFPFPIPEMRAWDARETAGKSEQDSLKMLGSDKNRLVVFYWGFAKCTRSHNGANWAVKNGYTNVYRHPGAGFLPGRVRNIKPQTLSRGPLSGCAGPKSGRSVRTHRQAGEKPFSGPADVLLGGGAGWAE